MQGNASPTSVPLLEVRGLEKSFASGGVFSAGRKTMAAKGVSFRIRAGEAVALVGESGSGKSTVARMLLRLEREDAGQVLLQGEDVRTLGGRGAGRGYRRRVQMVFQDPFGSLNPAHDVEHHLVRPLLRLGPALRDGDASRPPAPDPARDVTPRAGGPAAPPGAPRRAPVSRRAVAGALRARALELLRTVGLEPAEEFLHRRPYELSGGQRQRVAIARALAAEPDLLVADEPTSMLDVSIRMGILRLLEQLKRERGLAILIITHDLVSARFLADRILVMYRGRVVEEGPSGAVVDAPAHPYTRALLAAIADATGAGPDTPRAAPATGAAAAGCPFAARCPDVRDVCRSQDPAPRSFAGRTVRCHLYPGAAEA